VRIVIQRVKKASVSCDEKSVSNISKGLLILLGVTHEDTEEDVEWLVNKVLGLRIFSDDVGKMNLNVTDVDGDILVVSQFTLFASTKKGNRPSFIASARPELAEELYELFVNTLSRKRNQKTATGIFGADMQVELINDGPVTIIVDSRNRE
jgi:D-tyrosyl-tRNA(Tyr) deacylase